MNNPFKYGQVVTGQYFCERPDLQKLIKKNVDCSQNSFIEGERRTGKTSLVLETIAHLKKSLLIHIDLFQVRTPADVYSRILDGIIKANSKTTLVKSLMKSFTQLRPTMSIDPLTGSPSLSVGNRDMIMPDTVVGLLDFIQKKFTATVVFMDEFQDIMLLEDKEKMLAAMRSRIQLHTDITYLFAGSIRKEMNTVFLDPDSPFFKAAECITVQNINKLHFSSYILAKFKAGKRPVEEGVLEEVYQLTNEIPGDVQELCHALWDVTIPGDTIRQNTVNKALQEIYSRERRYYESMISLLTDNQIKCIKGVAAFNGKALFSARFLEETGLKQPSSTKKALTKLLDLKLLYRHNKEYRFANPFFRIWLVSFGH